MKSYTIVAYMDTNTNAKQADILIKGSRQPMKIKDMSTLLILTASPEAWKKIQPLTCASKDSLAFEQRIDHRTLGRIEQICIDN